MLGKPRRARTAVAALGVRAGLVLFGLLALAYAEIQPVAQTLYELGPELLAEPDMPVGEPSAALMAVWNALPVFSLHQTAARPMISALGKQGHRSEQAFESFGTAN